MQSNLIRVDVAELVAGRRLGRFHLDVVLLAGLAMLIDGFDTQVLGFAAPAMMRTLGVPPADLATMFTASGLGSVLGFLVLAPLGDRFGRKPVIVGSMIVFALLSLSTAAARSLTLLVPIRFLAGFALSGVVPCALALTAEFMPVRAKATMTMLVWFGFSLGSSAAGPVAGAILRRNGWPAIFLLAGFLPIMAMPLIWALLPESLHLMTRRGERARARIRATLIRISRRYDFLHTTIYYSSEKRETGFAVLHLFRHGRAPFTLLLWGMFFLSLMAGFLLNGWLPTALLDSGLQQVAVTVIVALGYLGGIIGGLIAAPLADRMESFAVLAGAFLLSALAIAAVGASSAGFLVASAAVFAGLFTLGTQNAANGVVATCYPSDMRATGIGWAFAAGRIGQIAAPLVASELVSHQLRLGTLFLIVAALSLMAAATAFLISLSRRGQGGPAGDVAAGAAP